MSAKNFFFCYENRQFLRFKFIWIWRELHNFFFLILPLTILLCLDSHLLYLKINVDNCECTKGLGLVFNIDVVYLKHFHCVYGHMFNLSLKVLTHSTHIALSITSLDTSVPIAKFEMFKALNLLLNSKILEKLNKSKIS